MLASDIDADLSGILSDPGSVTWTADDRLRAINAAVLDICAVKPKASTVSENLGVAPGSTRQAMPEDCFNVLGLTINMGADGATPGRPITTVVADRLGAAQPTWRADKGAAVRHLVLDDRDRSCFYVWPAIKTGPWYVEALKHKRPVPIAALSEPVPLADEYHGAVLEYALHMLYAKDGENGDHASLSQAHYAKYASMLGLQQQQQKKASAPTNSPENPAYPVVDKNGQ